MKTFMKCKFIDGLPAVHALSLTSRLLNVQPESDGIRYSSAMESATFYLVTCNACYIFPVGEC